MNRTHTTLLPLLLTLGLGLTACFAESDPAMGGDTTEAPGTDSDDESAGDDDVDPPGTTGQPPGTTDGDPPDTDDPPGTGTDGGSEFEFDESPPQDYAQVDRMGMPAINTAVITDKDEYNISSPADDAQGIFVDQIVANVAGLHAALDDDLMGAGLVPCEVEACVGQAAPLVVPDTLKIDLGGPAGFPNGRLPTDPVIDVTLAVVLLDLSAPGQTALSLVGLNPTANDLEFSEDFPYFAPPHQ